MFFISGIADADYQKDPRRSFGKAPSALTVSKCENVGPILALKFDSLILKTHLIWTKSKRRATFFRETFPHIKKVSTKEVN